MGFREKELYTGSSACRVFLGMRRVVPAKTAAAVGRMARLRNIGLNAIGQTE